MSVRPRTGFTPLPEALGRLEGACSPIAGIVTHVVRTMHGADHPSIPNHACRLASAQHTLGATTVEYGSGAAERHALARAAVGRIEFVEDQLLLRRRRRLRFSPTLGPVGVARTPDGAGAIGLGGRLLLCERSGGQREQKRHKRATATDFWIHALRAKRLSAGRNYFGGSTLVDPVGPMPAI